MKAKITKQGGKREGAGRPLKLSRQLEAVKKLATQLQSYGKLGLLRIGESYIKLVDRALELALQEDDRAMLRFLIQTFMQSVRVEDDEETPFGNILRKYMRGPLVVGQTVNVGGTRSDNGKPRSDVPPLRQDNATVEGMLVEVP